MRPSVRGTDNAFQAAEWAADDKDGNHRGARRDRPEEKKISPGAQKSNFHECMIAGAINR